MAEQKESDGSSSLHGKYELGRLLGHGTFAKVYHARHLPSGKNVAMKVVGKEKMIKVGMTEQIKKEISVMRMVKHPNIVELHEVMAGDNSVGSPPTLRSWQETMVKHPNSIPVQPSGLVSWPVAACHSPSIFLVEAVSSMTMSR
ncbi:hypothetical protein ACFX13_022207 [Malus domestica]